jgi:hypothetical protein
MYCILCIVFYELYLSIVCILCSPSSCCVTRTLNTAPAVPEIIATKTNYAKSQRIAVTKSKKKHEQSIVNSKSKRIAPQVSF